METAAPRAHAHVPLWCGTVCAPAALGTPSGSPGFTCAARSPTASKGQSCYAPIALLLPPFRVHRRRWVIPCVCGSVPPQTCAASICTEQARANDQLASELAHVSI